MICTYSTNEPRHDKTCLWEFPTRPDTNRPAQPQKLASLEILAIESRDIILSKQRTTKALIRLHGCAGWSAPLLFAYGIRHIFSWPGSCTWHEIKQSWMLIINLLQFELHHEKTCSCHMRVTETQMTFPADSIIPLLAVAEISRP